MSTGSSSRAGEYEGRAAALRRMAMLTKFPESRERLLALADSFEKLAARVAAREAVAD